MTLRMRDYGASRPRAATECEVLQASKPAVHNGLEPRIRYSSQQYPVDLPLRLDDAAASPTTPTGPTSVALLMKYKKELRLSRSTGEQREHASSGNARRLGNVVDAAIFPGHIIAAGALTVPPSCEVCRVKRCVQWRAPLGYSTDRHREAPKVCKTPLSQFIIAPRAQASRRCETQAPLSSKPLSLG